MSGCVFCKIVAGEIPSAKVYEDDEVLAFLDISPVNPGHTLVIPKAHTPDLLETAPAVVAAVMARIPPIARAVVGATQAEGFGLIQVNGPAAGQEVFHLHFHIIPRHSGDGKSLGWHRGSYEEGEMAALAGRIGAALESSADAAASARTD
jgi:histidine triad (HIT) family protein